MNLLFIVYSFANYFAIIMDKYLRNNLGKIPRAITAYFHILF